MATLPYFRKVQRTCQNTQCGNIFFVPPSDVKYSGAKFCSASCRSKVSSHTGKQHTPENRAKLAQILKQHQAIMIGADNPLWKGSNVGYGCIHKWMYRWFGKANKCEIDPLHTSKRFQWANLSGLYLRNRSDWMMMCGSCHKKHDLHRGKQTKYALA